jgi:polyribonucleotide nucleotidyltransferase
MRIEVDQIKDVIGKGGETINDIIEKCDDVKIDIDDEGLVTIYHYNQEAIDKAVKMIEDITRKANVGEIYDGKAVRVEDKYAFIELFPGTNGFLHVKDVAWDRTEKVSDVIKLGDIVKVKVTKITDKGVNVSKKALMPRPVKKEEKKEEAADE